MVSGDLLDKVGIALFEQVIPFKSGECQQLVFPLEFFHQEPVGDFPGCFEPCGIGQDEAAEFIHGDQQEAAGGQGLNGNSGRLHGLRIRINELPINEMRIMIRTGEIAFCTKR